jgi:FHS family L-fucose permease-like MFS transporter
MRVIAPARLLWMYALASIVLAAVAMFSHGLVSIAAVIGIAFFMSIMFPTIFSLGIADAGAHTEMGSSLLIMSIVGGALVPPVFGVVSDVTHNIQFAYAVPLVCFLFIAWFARAAAPAAKAALLNNGVMERV